MVFAADSDYQPTVSNAILKLGMETYHYFRKKDPIIIWHFETHGCNYETG